jgi:hypothetical protein
MTIFLCNMHLMCISGTSPHKVFTLNVIFFGDGVASQFKGARSWFYVARYPSLTTCDQLPLGCAMEWNY